MSSLRRAVLVIVAAAVLAIASSPAEAQYFGRNKVRYRTFKFQVLKTAHFDIYYYPEERLAIEQAGQMLERWYARLSKVLNHELSTRQPVILYASHPDFEQTNAIEGELGEGTGGVTEVLKRRIVLPMAGALAESDHVLGHELVHAFQFDITGHAGPVSEGNVPGALRLPLWFIEGMAEYLSIGPVDPHTAMWMRDAVNQARIDEKKEQLPSVRDLDNPRYFPYRWGQAFWAYVAGRWGDPVVGRMLRAAARANDFEPVVKEVLGVDSKQLSEEWHAALRDAYAPMLAIKESPGKYGPALITDKNAGELNIGPSLSPDGRRMIFLSSKNLFSIEMFLADAATGRVERRIVKTSADPHFDSLQFINSAGGWDRAGRRFAFGAVSKGNPVLSILDVDRGAIEREVPFKQLGEIFDPTWSPDGRRIAFVALVNGLMDLFIYDLQSGALKRATDDAFAELQPAWSPDGRRIAFVTDRFTTRLETLATGDYRLATIDPDSGEIRPLPGFETGKNIDPQWSRDGASLFFISDRNGISNVYRAALDTGTIFQVTDLLTGVTGITSLSPALSVGGDRLVYSAYEAEKHSIYAVNDRERMAGFPPVQESAVAAALPPLERRRAEVASLRENATLGLPDRKKFGTDDYKAKLALDYVGQPSVGIGTDPFGTYVGGSVALLFSDMLGNHTIGTSLQIQGSFDDFGGVVFYQNRKHRWDWGVALQQVPYLTGGYGIDTGVVEGVPVIIQQTLLDRQIDRNVTAFAAYPFSRAHRFELSAAARRISFKSELRTEFFDINTGQFLGQEKEKLPSAEALNLAEGGAALVYDTSIFGATSPILGRRYRLEVTPTFGTVQYTGVLADIRQYVMPVRPYTLAARVIHYGRYGNGAEDERFFPLFLGYPQLIRGYDYNSFSADECGTTDGSCPVFDQLLGSRLILANAELRFPLFGAFGAKSFYGPIPIELVGFADAGIAWTRNEKAEFMSGGTRKWVKSVGAGARINLFGYAVVEIDYVKPLDRPRKGWIWQFNFSPGW
jgi:Tol biopolymer transport system component